MIKVIGDKKLVHKLQRLSKTGANRANRAAVMAGTRVLRAAVVAEVPVDEGLLKKAQALKVQTRRGMTTGRVGADVAKLKEYDSSGLRPSNIDHLVHEGHMAYGRFFVPANRYLDRAASRSMASAMATYNSKLKERIEVEAVRG